MAGLTGLGRISLVLLISLTLSPSLSSCEEDPSSYEDPDFDPAPASHLWSRLDKKKSVLGSSSGEEGLEEDEEAKRKREENAAWRREARGLLQAEEEKEEEEENLSWKKRSLLGVDRAKREEEKESDSEDAAATESWRLAEVGFNHQNYPWHF